jgi:hypothetical protein
LGKDTQSVANNFLLRKVFMDELNKLSILPSIQQLLIVHRLSSQVKAKHPYIDKQQTPLSHKTPPKIDSHVAKVQLFSI